MKKYLFLAALLGSSSCMAFPDYNVVGCSANINGHFTYLEYNRANHIFSLSIDGSSGASYASEAGNRIITNPEYDEDGNLLVGEILSNDYNWKANFNIYLNNRLVMSNPVYCGKVAMKLSSVQQKSLAAELSKLKPAN
ncbi:hypothetical protein ACFORL_09535 [Legionella dresdenensis]|uniref:Lipoprotein n=1 Tax=Legionella dresdenensis TaxID=450200 RepID=A0ABV8CGP1_9GAMM